MCKTQQDWNKDGHNIQDTCAVNISSKVLKKKRPTNQLIEITIYIALSILSVASNYKQVIKIQELPNGITKSLQVYQNKSSISCHNMTIII